MLKAALLAVLLVSQAHSACETILATDSSKVAKTGDTMTGPLVFSGASSYVTAVSSINGQGIWGTFTGDLTGDVTGNCSGNAGTATALAANGANCSAGEAALGVSAAGAAEGCYDVATQTELNTHTSDTAAHSATDANTASRIVMRDASGNFAAGTITANLTGAVTGNATTATALAANGANCSAGSYPLGVDASGAVESCTSASTGAGKLKNHTSTTTVDFWSARGIARTYNDTESTQAQGFMLVNTTFTATDASSKLHFVAHVEGCEPSNTIDMAWLSLHKDNTQAAICEGGNTHFAGTAVRPQAMHLECDITAGDTSAHVYSLRIQNDTANDAVAVNGCSTRFLGGNQTSGLYIEEKGP